MRRKSREDFGEAEVRYALALRACPVCTLSSETEHAALSWLADANYREDATIERISDSQGLCAGHWAALLERRSDLGMSGVELFERIVAAIDRDHAHGHVTLGTCPICATVRRRSVSTIQILLDRLRDPMARFELNDSFGLCRPHLVLAASDCLVDERRMLTRMYDDQLDRLLGRLREQRSDNPARQLLFRELAAKLGGSQRGAISGDRGPTER